MTSTRLELESTTCALLEAFRVVGSEITWCPLAGRILDLVCAAYDLYNNVDEVTRAVYALMLKVKEFEKFLCLDLERHIALRNGRCPFHFKRADQLLQRVMDGVQTLQVVGRSSPGPWPDRNWDHLTAEIQAALSEYGFCTTMDAIYDVGEAGIKLDAVCAKLDRIEKTLTSGDGTDLSLRLVQLHSATADYNGIQQSMTQANIEKLKAKFETIEQKIVRLENNISSCNIRADSGLFVRYLAGQHLLRQDFVSKLHHADNTAVITHHMIHPGTRGWLMERFTRWLDNSDKKLLLLAGKHGSGKTAFASAVCKLYNQNLVACHFFDSSSPQGGATNCINGMIQGIAQELCHTLPEYLNYLDDKVQSIKLDTLMSRGWEENYQLLLKEPLQTLYSFGKSKTSIERRHLVVIDGADECQESEWGAVQSFLGLFLRDMSNTFCLFVTVRSKFFPKIMPALTPDEEDQTDGIRLEDRVWINRHIKDIEVYLSSSLGAILSGEDERELPQHAKVDVMTLQNTIDELLKCSSGRFDFAIELMETFAQEMSRSGQFLSSIKKAMQPIRQHHGSEFEEKMSGFASPYRAYRDKEGRSVDVRVMRQSHYLMDKTRVALIRGRHKIHQLNQNGK